MRLLKYGENEDLSIAEFDEATKPAYAILSHRWGAEADEVTFEDVVGNTGRNKPGYAKIRFCGEQAQRDGLQYFWVDTCCINKANKAELSLAIQSMFRWYRNSARCYVYLSDVSSRPLDTTPACKPQALELQRNDQFTWIWILLFMHPVFRWYHVMLQRFFVLLNVSGPQAYESREVQKSEWFTRGWTLQELLAPSSVEFFSREWEKLGDKRSLIQQVQEATGIPRLALQGASLSEFSINKRLRWIEHRRTTHPEDKVYSLLGVVDVDLAPCYGEGVDGAFRRLHDEIDKTKRCIQDLCSTDPHADKKRIQDTKGGLLKDSYRWVLHNDSFRQWHDDPHSRLLWIKGDPGKGKTMLLCGIIDELQASSTIAKTNTVSYFFCQATDARINSATAVLRGLLYMLVKQQQSLASHVRKKYDEAGKNLFEDANAWVALVDMFTEMLRDPSLTTTYLIVDALDECVTNLPELLDFVAEQSSASSRVKWIVSSRNWPVIKEQLEQAGHKVKLSLELNAASVSAAVQAYIEQRASELAQQNRYDERTKRAVLEHLTSNANDTFLWVALVCQHLQATARRNVLIKLKLFPPGLDALYERMMQQISKTDDAELCKQVLAAVALVYRPIALKELVTLVEPLESIADDLELREIISLCGSFLTLQEQTVYFVHQSAKDFLLAEAARDVFPAGQEAVHQVIFARSLQIMSTALRRDIYGLKALGTPIDDVVVPTPDPLAALRYSCVHWVEHLCASNPMSSATYAECLRGRGVVDRFLREKCLYWLESLSLCKSMSKGIVLVKELQMLVQGQGEATPFTQLVYDVYRFVMYYKQAIESNPLQAYGSALLFSPKQSVVRKLFQHEGLEGIALKPGMSDGWSACLQTLEGHSRDVSSVAFSHDSTRLASASGDNTVKIWDASSGACLQTLEGHSYTVRSVAFSHDSMRLASASDDRTVKMWDASSGACVQTLEGHSHIVSSVAFSHDSTRLASASYDNTVKIWDASSGACLQTLKGHSRDVSSVAFSHDSTRLASASGDRTIKIWDASSGACVQTLEGHSDWVISVAFSHDSTRLASASWDNTVKIWDASSGACLQTLDVGKTLFNLSFDAASSCLLTENGSVDISASTGSGAESVTVLQPPQYLDAGVSSDNTWITYNGKHLLWIPPEYRPLCSSVCGNMIGMGAGSGRVWVCSINL